MKNKVLYIVGAIALLGGGAFLFLKNKKAKDALVLEDVKKEAETAQAQIPAVSTPAVSSSIDAVIEPLNFLQQIKRKEAQRILDWVTRSKPSIAETAVKFEKIKALGFKVVGNELIPIS